MYVLLRQSMDKSHHWPYIPELSGQRLSRTSKDGSSLTEIPRPQLFSDSHLDVEFLEKLRVLLSWCIDGVLTRADALVKVPNANNVDVLIC